MKFNKKNIFIIGVIIILIAVILVVINLNNGSFSEEKAMKSFEKILDSEEKIVLKVNDDIITERDIAAAKILSYEDIKDVEKMLIENKVIKQEAQRLNIEIEEKDRVYDENIISGLRDDEKINSMYNDAEKEEILVAIQKKLLENSICNEFKHQIRLSIMNGTFTTTNKDIEKKYHEYREMQEKWNSRSGIEYTKLVSARDEFVNYYIEILVANSNIEKLK